MSDTPMDLADILGNSRDQTRGRWFDLRHPVTGEPTGIRLQIAGPDSDQQRRAQLRLADRLAELADTNGRVTAEDRHRARIEALAECVTDWAITENGKPLPHSFVNVLRLLKAARWVEEQADQLAGMRSNFMGEF
ncbi:MAG: hypothetical protein U1E34_00705 [Amaricoccus sp.]